jgi:hypothetical protein
VGFGNQYSMPSSSFGYYRGQPLAGGQGSGQGEVMAGTSVFSAGQGTNSGNTSGWSPTILYLFALIVAEMFIFAFIGRHV